MRAPSFKTYLFLLFFVFVVPLSVTHCTSSDEDPSVLEEELEGLEDGGDPMADEVEDLSDLAEGDLEDVVDEEDMGEDLSYEDEDLLALEDKVESDAQDDIGDELDEAFDDGDTSDDEFAEFDDEKFEDSDDEFDEFDEFEDEKSQQFAENEKSLQEELNKQQNLKQDYPIIKEAQPQFPEEVVGTSPAPAPATSTTAPVAGGFITSETQAVNDLPDPIEPTIPQDDLGMADPITPLAEDEMPGAPGWVPVVKIKTDPFFRNQRLMNAVYIVRPDDSMDSISQKIYGSDRVKELNDDNPHLAKGIDPGDKVYYNSPNRSEDRSTVKFYYDDVGLKPQIYRTVANDNMRRLGVKLLGFKEGWKEIWAINPSVDSKTILPSGLELRYWTGHEQNENLMAATEDIMPDENMDQAMGAGSIEDPFADSELPPEPPLPEAQVAGPDPTLEPEPLPDIQPIPDESIQPTPGPPVMANQNQNESLLTVGAVALLIMAGAGLVAIQIKKRKDNTAVNPASLEYTQV
jgi:hypothetical protein